MCVVNVWIRPTPNQLSVLSRAPDTERQTEEWITDVDLFVLLCGCADRMEKKKRQHMPCDLRHLTTAATR